MKPQLRRDEYIENLLKREERETRNLDAINQRNLLNGEGLTSPTSAVSTEETRMLMEYMDQKNLIKIGSTNEARRKILTLKKFLKKKRNQQVEIYSNSGPQVLYTEGKVAAVGRDFVMLSNLKDRFWIPYHAIESANIPYGIPNYSNTHQHYIYDNDLRSKLLLQFGETVSKREELFQQFCEDSFASNLRTWRGSRVEVKNLKGEVFSGKIQEAKDDTLMIKQSKGNINIELSQVTYIRTLRLLHIVKTILKRSRKE
ncbi:hypothetical protein V1502_09810 [Bacillus sp. SCS-153A]|uniref:hypothetical protein n=1 Tax=Rossellomorea sedimentorum TaxID=3115294 RepID=UPI003905E8C2